jgi:hypothetical protein
MLVNDTIQLIAVVCCDSLAWASSCALRVLLVVKAWLGSLSGMILAGLGVSPRSP